MTLKKESLVQENKAVQAGEISQDRQALFAEMGEMPADKFLAQHSRIFDNYFEKTFERSRIGPRLFSGMSHFALIALGGYGRSEMCLGSDVDLLFLFSGKVPESADSLVEEYVYPLWDAGLDVGYAIRCISETTRLAQSDYQVFTSILDARFICGDSSVFMQMTDLLREKIIAKRRKRIEGWLADQAYERSALFGESTHLLEPNIKEGAGGLRDYHTILWLAKVRFGISGFRDVKLEGIWSENEFERLWNALVYLWDIRNRLHRLCGRKCDRLYFPYQARLAGIDLPVSGQEQERVEEFISRVHSSMRLVRSELDLFVSELGIRKRIFFRKIHKKHTLPPGLRISDEGIGFASARRIASDPRILVRIFFHAARLGVRVTREGCRLVREFRDFARSSFLEEPELREA